MISTHLKSIFSREGNPGILIGFIKPGFLIGSSFEIFPGEYKMFTGQGNHGNHKNHSSDNIEEQI